MILGDGDGLDEGAEVGVDLDGIGFLVVYGQFFQKLLQLEDGFADVLSAEIQCLLFGEQASGGVDALLNLLEAVFDGVFLDAARFEQVHPAFLFLFETYIVSPAGNIAQLFSSVDVDCFAY